MNIEEMQQKFPVGKWLVYRSATVEWASELIGQVCEYREVTINDFDRTRVMCADVRSLGYSAMIQPSQVVATFDPESFCRQNGLSKYYSPLDRATIFVDVALAQPRLI